MQYKEQIDLSRIPQHVAIIMDGNGRWAKQRGHERSYGHQIGAETVHVIAEEAARLGIRYLTLYVLNRKLEPSYRRSCCSDEPSFRFHRRRYIHEEQHQFPDYRRYRKVTRKCTNPFIQLRRTYI